MFLKQILLENIRSYHHTEISFPRGTLLFSGDIGSGKTSILLAIEFAFFGLQPGQRGTSLLRNNSNEGKVVLVFDIDNNEFIVERSIKRSKSVSQEYCALTINNIKKEMSVTELKSSILALLNYPSEFSKKQNLLYRFTVYTPQEAMKQIILEDPSSRMNILRNIFGLERYKRVIENTTIISSKLREEKRKKEGMIYDLEEKRQLFLHKEQQLEDCQKNLSSWEKELFLRREERRQKEEALEVLNKKMVEKRKLESELANLQSLNNYKQQTISKYSQMTADLNKELETAADIYFQPEIIIESGQILEKLRNEKEFFDNQYLQTNSAIHLISSKLSDIDNLHQKINLLEECPTCLQSVDISYKSAILRKFNDDKKLLLEKVNGHEQMRINLQQQKNEVQQKIKDIENQLTEQKLNQLKSQRLEEKKRQLQDYKEQCSKIEQEIFELKNNLKIIQDALSSFQHVEETYSSQRLSLEESLKLERTVEIKTTEIKKEAELLDVQCTELKGEIEKKEAIKKGLQKIQEFEQWLSTDFIQCVSLIEKQVMIKIREEFSSLFQKWFSLLVVDTLTVRLTEDFTPIIEQQDYELEYDYLSGGERTAVALAYRLALHQVINSLLSSLKTKGLIILDEPTDGFSEQQLERMRDIFQQIQAEQLILVSHEQKIEGFVENIIKIKKEDGVSKVEI